MRHVMHILEGTWFILSSSFPMWLNGQRKQPSFTYKTARKHGEDVLMDETCYYKNGKRHSITGIDYPRPNKTFGFVWRHRFLPFIKSNWEVVYMNIEEKWAVIYFSETFWTPAGVDIICKGDITAARLKQIKQRMCDYPLLKQFADAVRDIK